ncbi:hypothetical protein CTAYLR_000269 [Chrysophaeum taylorii]|uniref:SWIM-type domain-containing protein n=1 Tax=Chrysophaeum taylorii TaxID=2483200 RepID=A0AAD7UEI0_9STRA|nr:hypothetical protein CTAYLR_000269 [Chrysophaeum taylorii]
MGASFDQIGALDALLELILETTSDADGANPNEKEDGETLASREAVVRRRALRVVNDLFDGDAQGRALVDGAINVLDTRRLYRVVTQPSARSFVAVDPGFAAAAKRYVCFDDFCSCPGFAQVAADADGPILCKHMLAARLAPLVLNTFETKYISDAQYHEAISCRYDPL